MTEKYIVPARMDYSRKDQLLDEITRFSKEYIISKTVFPYGVITSVVVILEQRYNGENWS